MKLVAWFLARQMGSVNQRLLRDLDAAATRIASTGTAATGTAATGTAATGTAATGTAATGTEGS